MKASLVLCALIATSLPAFAQEAFLVPTKMQLSGQGRMQQPRPGDAEWSSTFVLRYSMIGGGGAAAQWSDDFQEGFGFRGETNYEYHLDSHWSVGGYVSAGLDLFGGKSQGGFTLDDLLALPFTVGAKGKFYFGQGFFAEAYLGIGIVDYGAVGVSGPGLSLPVFTESVAFAFEVGGQVGYKVGPNIALVVGLGYESWGHPGVDPNGPASGLPQHRIENVTIDLGICFRF